MYMYINIYIYICLKIYIYYSTYMLSETDHHQNDENPNQNAYFLILHVCVMYY